MNWHGRHNGVGCFVCKKRSGEGNQQLLMNENHQCDCDVCKCYCSAAYKRHEHTAVARQAQADKVWTQVIEIDNDDDTKSDSILFDLIFICLCTLTFCWFSQCICKLRRLNCRSNFIALSSTSKWFFVFDWRQSNTKCDGNDWIGYCYFNQPEQRCWEEEFITEDGWIIQWVLERYQHSRPSE